MSGVGAVKRVPLGATGIEIPELGVGVWQWGDTSFWGYGREYGAAEIRAAFDVSMARGLDFFDSAEIYGSGASERNLGAFVRQAGRPAIVASKFFPFPWRLRGKAVPRAARASLERLGLERIDLYQIHWPYPPVPIETWVAGLAEAVEQGLIRCRWSLQFQPRADSACTRRAGAPQHSAGLQPGALQPARPRPGTLRPARRLPQAERDPDRLLPVGARIAHGQVHAPESDTRLCGPPAGVRCPTSGSAGWWACCARSDPLTTARPRRRWR